MRKKWVLIVSSFDVSSYQNCTKKNEPQKYFVLNVMSKRRLRMRDCGLKVFSSYSLQPVKIRLIRDCCCRVGLDRFNRGI